jgi:glycosyltransferase involved in cell wall biosynthesis
MVYMGRLTEMKGVSHAIRSTAIASSMLGTALTLVIAGDGPELETCRALARSSTTPIEVLGWVNGEQRLELLKGADALVVPSLWPEPFGMVGIEAGCLGVPSVGYAAGGIVDWLEPGVSGELAEPFDVASLGAALTRALSGAEHHQRLRLGAWAKARSYGTEKHLRTLLALFEACVQH